MQKVETGARKTSSSGSQSGGRAPLKSMELQQRDAARTKNWKHLNTDAAKKIMFFVNIYPCYVLPIPDKICISLYIFIVLMSIHLVHSQASNLILQAPKAKRPKSHMLEPTVLFSPTNHSFHRRRIFKVKNQPDQPAETQSKSQTAFQGFKFSQSQPEMRLSALVSSVLRQ